MDKKLYLEEEDLAKPQGQEIRKEVEKLNEPTIVQPIVEDCFRSFIPKAPCPERLKALKKKESWPLLVQSSARGAIKRMPPLLQHLHCGNFEAVTCDRTQCG